MAKAPRERGVEVGSRSNDHATFRCLYRNHDSSTSRFSGTYSLRPQRYYPMHRRNSTRLSIVDMIALTRATIGECHGPIGQTVDTVPAPAWVAHDVSDAFRTTVYRAEVASGTPKRCVIASQDAQSHEGWC
jgi:hypothetical protein